MTIAASTTASLGGVTFVDCNMTKGVVWHGAEEGYATRVAARSAVFCMPLLVDIPSLMIVLVAMSDFRKG